MRDRVPLHPVLLAAYLVLHLYAENLSEVLLVDVVSPLARSVGGALVAFAIASLVFRSARRGALVASAGVVAFHAYGHAAPALASWGFDDRGQLTVWAAAIVLAAIYAWRARGSLGPVTGVLNVVALVLVVLVTASIVPYELGRASRGSVARAATAPDAAVDGPARDIWYLVFDRFGSDEAIERRFGGAVESDLDEWLASQGFQVPAVSRAAYRATDFSLASTLNLRYLDELTETVGRASGDRTPAHALLEDHEVGRFLREQGYRYYHVGSWFGPTVANAHADESLTFGATSEFESVLRDTTVLPAVDRALGNEPVDLTFRERHRESALFQLRQLRRLTAAPGPKFVFAHVLLPHDPYVFHGDGSPITEAEARATDEAALYQGHVTFVSRHIRETVETLLAGPDSTDPIVIIQADEGPLVCRNVDCPSLDPDYLAVRFGVLNAMYLPGSDVAVPDRFTSVNTFRLVFDAYFGADLPLLPDRSFTWPDNDHLYDFQDVTELLDDP